MTDTVAERLAEQTDRPVEVFESDAPLPELDDLESVAEEER